MTGALNNTRVAWLEAINVAAYAAGLPAGSCDLFYGGALNDLTRGRIGQRWLEKVRTDQMALHDGDRGMVAVTLGKRQ